MRAEHCSRGGHRDYFVTDNYSVRTCPADEWDITAGGNFALADTRHDRRLATIEELMRREIVGLAGLMRCEVIAVALYTGPMVRCTGLAGRPPPPPPPHPLPAAV